MYAHAIVPHAPLPDQFTVNCDDGDINVHLPNIYLSFKPEEAERLGRILLWAAEEARLSIAAKATESPAEGTEAVEA